MIPTPTGGLGILPFVLAGLVGAAAIQTYRAYQDPHGAAFPEGGIIPEDVMRPRLPAAPQAAGQMTSPSAWSPDIMYAQTARERDVFRSGVTAGSQFGSPTGTPVYETDWFIVAALGVGAILLLRR